MTKDKPTDKGSTNGGSPEPEFPPGTPLPRVIRSAFEDRNPGLTLRKKRRLGEGKAAKPAEAKAPKRCSVCSGDHPTRMCDVGA